MKDGDKDTHNTVTLQVGWFFPFSVMCLRHIENEI